MPDLRLYATCFRGLGEISRREVRRRLETSELAHRQVRDFDLFHFTTSESASRVSDLLTIEDAYFELDVLPLSGGREDLDLLRRRATRWDVEAGIAAKRQVTPRNRKGSVSYRVVVQAQDAEWRGYRREAIAETVTAAIDRRYARWYAVPDGGDLEVWVQIADREAIIGLRLTDRTMRHRSDKAVNLPGSLRPTLAAAMISLAKSNDDDIFLDPMCGAGTLLLERAREGRYKELLGGDIRQDAVAATFDNLGSRYKPWRVRKWDATRLPIDDSSVTQVVTNPPWGRQIGSKTELGSLYRGVFAELDRVSQPGASIVILTSEWDTFKTALASQQSLVTTYQIRRVHVLGRIADIFVMLKT